MAEQIRKTRGRKPSLLVTGMALIVLFLMMYLMLPTVIFLFLSMMPTFVSQIANAGSRSNFKYRLLSIGGLNFAGSLPFLFRLWFGDNSWSGAFGMFMGSGHFAIIYMTAFIGWLFYRFIPPIVLSFLDLSDQRRVADLREAQAKLVAKWGEDIVSGLSTVAKNNKPSAERKN